MTLTDWKATRHAPPERRVLMGELPAGPVLRGRPGAGRGRAEPGERAAAAEAGGVCGGVPGREPGQAVPAEQGAVRRVQVVAGGPAAAAPGRDRRASIATCTRPCCMSNLRDGDRLVLYPRWTVDERLPEDRAEGVHADAQADALRPAGRTGPHRRHREGRGGPGHGGVRRGRVEGVPWRRLRRAATSSRRSTGRWRTASSTRSTRARTTGTPTGAPRSSSGLCDGAAERPLRPAGRRRPPPGDGAGSPGQAAFLAGLDAFRDAGLLHDFEAEQAGVHRRARPDAGAAGPGAARHGQESTRPPSPSSPGSRGRCRRSGPSGSFLSCKTHAATDVLLKNVLEVREKLRELRKRRPEAVRQPLRRPAARRAAYRVAPQRPAARRRDPPGARTTRRRTTRTTTPT